MEAGQAGFSSHCGPSKASDSISQRVLPWVEGYLLNATVMSPRPSRCQGSYSQPPRDSESLRHSPKSAQQ